jgi:hypothetical protein
MTVVIKRPSQGTWTSCREPRTRRPGRPAPHYWPRLRGDPRKMPGASPKGPSISAEGGATIYHPRRLIAHAGAESTCHRRRPTNARRSRRYYGMGIKGGDEEVGRWSNRPASDAGVEGQPGRRWERVGRRADEGSAGPIPGSAQIRGNEEREERRGAGCKWGRSRDRVHSGEPRFAMEQRRDPQAL